MIFIRHARGALATIQLRVQTGRTLGFRLTQALSTLSIKQEDEHYKHY